RDLAAMWLDAKRTQVAALNDVGLSLAEYRWIRSSAYQALGAPYLDLHFARTAAAARVGGQPTTPVRFERALRGAAPAAHRQRAEVDAGDAGAGNRAGRLSSLPAFHHARALGRLEGVAAIARGDSGTPRRPDPRRHQFSETGPTLGRRDSAVLWRARQDRELP